VLEKVCTKMFYVLGSGSGPSHFKKSDPNPDKNRPDPHTASPVVQTVQIHLKWQYYFGAGKLLRVVAVRRRGQGVHPAPSQEQDTRTQEVRTLLQVQSGFQVLQLVLFHSGPLPVQCVVTSVMEPQGATSSCWSQRQTAMLLRFQTVSYRYRYVGRFF
jgi:hypothetical protein